MTLFQPPASLTPDSRTPSDFAGASPLTYMTIVIRDLLLPRWEKVKTTYRVQIWHCQYPRLLSLCRSPDASVRRI
jgi:hypothetical protein